MNSIEKNAKAWRCFTPAPRRRASLLIPFFTIPMRHFPAAVLLCVSLSATGLSLGALAASAAPPVSGPVDASPAAAPVPAPFDQWFVDAADGKKTGWSRRTLEQNADGQWVTTERSYSAEMHGGDKVEQRGSKVTVETAGLRLLSIVSTSTQKSAAGEQTVVQKWAFTDKDIRMESSQGGSKSSRILPLPKGEWVTPAKAFALHAQHHKAGDKAFEISMYDPGLGQAPYKASYARLGDETLDLPAGKVKATKYKMTYSNMPGVVTYEWYDAAGKFVNNAFTMSGVLLSNKWATPAIAQADFTPVEMTGMSVVAVDKAIPTPALLRKVVYELNYSAECPLVPPALGPQSVEKLANGRVKVTVDLDAAGEPGPAPVPEDMGTSIMVDWKDPAVLALLPRIYDRFAGEKLSDDKKARECARFVSRYMSPTLGVSAGTASQTAKTKNGDCTEHAVLLTALLRASGIPARCATGMAYAGEEGFVDHKNAFIFHAWSQAWIKDENGKGRWVNYDAALRRYDAVHILLGASAQDDATGADEETKLMPLMEGMKVKLLKAE